MASPVAAMAASGPRWAPPVGSRDDAVDDAEPQEVLGGDLHVRRRILRAAESRHRIEAAPSGEITL